MTLPLDSHYKILARDIAKSQSGSTAAKLITKGSAKRKFSKAIRSAIGKADPLSTLFQKATESAARQSTAGPEYLDLNTLAEMVVNERRRQKTTGEVKGRTTIQMVKSVIRKLIGKKKKVSKAFSEESPASKATSKKASTKSALSPKKAPFQAASPKVQPKSTPFSKDLGKILAAQEEMLDLDELDVLVQQAASTNSSIQSSGSTRTNRSTSPTVKPKPNLKGPQLKQELEQTLTAQEEKLGLSELDDLVRQAASTNAAIQSSGSTKTNTSTSPTVKPKLKPKPKLNLKGLQLEQK